MVWIIDLLRNAGRALRNLLARMPGPPVDFVVVELTGSYPERTPPRPPLFRRMLRPPWQQPEESLEDLRARLERLAASRARGIVLRIRDLQVAPPRLAAAQSLREALADFRRRGKRIIAYLTEAALADYYVATAADEIWMPEAGTWAVTGLRTEITFFRAAFDRAGIAPEFERIAEYKTAADPFMRPAMSEHHREALESVLESIMGDIIRSIAESRRLDPAAVQTAIDRAPLEAEDARAARLIDGVGYEDELPARLGSPERPAALVPWLQARRRLPVPYRWRARMPVVGVVELIGAIIPGESRDTPFPLPLVGGKFAGSETVARAFRAAERDPRVRAVVFHVDSGGGSALASDQIWREVQRVKAKKPVVVSMGNVAGSGGYYVACGASRIIAQPATITGSIGVINGKLTARGLYARLGLNREIVARGEAATIDSLFEPFSPAQLERIRRQMHAIYRRFVTKVAAGRKKNEADVEAIGRGRIWTGAQALDRGLVDELGDFALAVRRARELATIPADVETQVVTIRPPRVSQVPSATGILAQATDGLRAVRDLQRERVLLLMPEVGGSG